MQTVSTGWHPVETRQSTSARCCPDPASYASASNLGNAPTQLALPQLHAGGSAHAIRRHLA